MFQSIEIIAIDAAEKKFAIAKSAEYFWFMEVEERVPALENELEKEHQRQWLSSWGRSLQYYLWSGYGSSLVNVLMIPKTDGNVFIQEQSERAPLLLLMEVRRDENGLDDKESSSEAIY